MSVALRVVDLLPNMVPLFCKVPLVLMLMFWAAMREPLGRRSFAWRRLRKTWGTRSFSDVPLGRVTSRDTIHTMSWVRAATWARVRATPGIRFWARASLRPCSMRAMNSASSLV